MQDTASPNTCPELVRPARPEIRIFLNESGELSIQRSDVGQTDTDLVSIPLEDAQWVAEGLLEMDERSREELAALDDLTRAEV